MKKAKEFYIGQRFGRLTVVQLDHIRSYIRPNGRKRNLEYYLCVCDCGNTTVTQKDYLKSGDCKSCGCLKTETDRSKTNKHRKHGMTDTILYSRWRCIKERCYNPHNVSYKHYGGRRIKMDDSWRNSFYNFFLWATKNGFSPELTIDRINPNGDYTPDNCRWATINEQNNNKTSNNKITINGETDTITNWCRRFKINRQSVYKRLYRGWDIIRAITEPMHRGRHASNTCNL